MMGKHQAIKNRPQVSQRGGFGGSVVKSCNSVRKVNYGMVIANKPNVSITRGNIMRNVVSGDGVTLGIFNGNTIRDSNGALIYAVIDGDVFAPVRYVDEALQPLSKGLLGLVGTLVENEAMTDSGEIIFELKP